MNIKEIERVVGALQSKLFKKANSSSAGVMRSRFKGSGLQFREHQIYSPGDDVRFIDWKLSARSTHTYIKTFEEDRNVEIVCLVDINKNFFYGSNMIPKIQIVLDVIAFLMLISKENSDRVRTVFFLKDQKHELPLSVGKEGLVAVIRLCEKLNLLKSDGTYNYQLSEEIAFNKNEQILKAAKYHLSRKREVLFFSDFDSYDEKKIKELQSQFNFHGVMVGSPVDLKPLDYTITSGRNQRVETGQPFEANFLKQKNMIELSTDSKYLDDFVRKMR